jgi:NADH-quinone oxidoreductase subunit C
VTSSRLPTADLETFAAQRRAANAKAADRRVARELELAERAITWLGESLTGRHDFRRQVTLFVKLERVHALLLYLRDSLGFDMLIDLTAVDYLKSEGDHPERFAVVYYLCNTAQGARLRIRTYVDEDQPLVPTACDVWKAANWAEREVYDMYGIEFSGHPNLIRLLLPQEYSGFPLRKDYPLRGRGERDNFPVIRRAGEADA